MRSFRFWGIQALFRLHAPVKVVDGQVLILYLLLFDRFRDLIIHSIHALCPVTQLEGFLTGMERAVWCLAVSRNDLAILHHISTMTVALHAAKARVVGTSPYKKRQNTFRAKVTIKHNVHSAGNNPNIQ